MSDGINKKDVRTDNPFKDQPVAIQLFPELIIPNGFLSPIRESMACWYYFVLARRNYEVQQDAIFYEGHRDPDFNYRQLYTSIAKMYGVEPEAMAKCWGEVDKTAFALGLPLLPDEERYRFDRQHIVTLRTPLQNWDDIMEDVTVDQNKTISKGDFEEQYLGKFEPGSEAHPKCKNNCPDCKCKIEPEIESPEELQAFREAGNKLIADGLELAKEREWLGKCKVKCHKCNSVNIQLIDTSLQEWKCRSCKHVFFTSLVRANKDFRD